MKVSLYKTNKQTKNSCIFQLFLKNEPENENGATCPANFYENVLKRREPFPE